MHEVIDFSGSTEITGEGIKKHFNNFDPITAIFELVWNGLDAEADHVHISIRRNEMSGLESVTVLDNGEGIDVGKLNDTFGKFNESQKRFDHNKHGSQGKGRLAFHKLSKNAIWFTRRLDAHVKISIDSSSIKKFEANSIEREKQHAYLSSLVTGTCVELRNFCSDLPDEDDVREKFAIEFGWLLALNNDKHININNRPLVVPKHNLYEKKIEIDDYVFNITTIRWHEKPTSEKSFNYLISKNNQIVDKSLSGFNNKFKFYTSTYASSNWIDGFNPEGLPLFDSHHRYSDVYRTLVKEMDTFQREIYDEFLRTHVDGEIERFDEKGFFPDYRGHTPEFAKFQKNHTKKILKEIYIAEPSMFNSIRDKQAKIIIRLLDKVLISNENDTLLDVLDGVLDLEEDSLQSLANQLHKTTLENIVSTIEVLQKRELAVHQLREIMTNRASEVLETPDMQKIIESNTWLFGPQYTTLGAEEDDFVKIARNLRKEIKEISTISQSDVDEDANIEGIRRQVDLFLARKIPAYDSRGKEYFRCIIVEIKRPGVSLNKKHLTQLDDYAEVISKHSAFNSTCLKFELILIGRKISRDDYKITSRLGSLIGKGESGLVTDDEVLGIKCYVKSWFTIFDEFDLSNQYLLGNLNSKLESLSDRSTEDLVNNLQINSA